VHLQAKTYIYLPINFGGYLHNNPQYETKRPNEARKPLESNLGRMPYSCLTLGEKPKALFIPFHEKYNKCFKTIHL
jgi:hypothetical protein